MPDSITRRGGIALEFWRCHQLFWVLALVLLLFSWGCMSKDNYRIEQRIIKIEQLQQSLEKLENRNLKLEEDLEMLAMTNGQLEKRLASVSETMLVRERQHKNDRHTTMKYIERLHQKNKEITRRLAVESPKPTVDTTTEAIQEGPEHKQLFLSSGASGRDNAQYKRAVTDTLRQVKRLVSKIDRAQLTKEQGATFSMIQGFMSNAKEAFEKKEFSKALNLGDKAHTLANELLSVAQK